MPSSIRRATLSDADSAVAVLRRSITLGCERDHQHDAATLQLWLRNKTIEHFERWLLDPKNVTLVCPDGEGVCGVGLVSDRGHIHLCYVRPDRQGRGVGKALLSALEDQARRWGLTEMSLTSTATARAFYEKLGYGPDGPPLPTFGVATGYPLRKHLCRPASPAPA